MSQGNRTSGSFSFGPFVWFVGVVEDRKDPEKLGRVKVRIFGYHDSNTQRVTSEDLFWAMVMMPTNSSGSSGVGASPTGLVEGSTVIGFFMDGHAAQTPIVIGTLGGKPKKESQIAGGGFKDPFGIFPLYEEGESSVNRLARGEKTDETYVEKRKKDKTKTKVAFGGQWEEPDPSYAAEYPFNHVNMTESGHVFEMDDTKDGERINLGHKSGTFFEIGPDGTKVDKVKKDKYTITAGDNYVKIEGECTLTISKDVLILTEKDAKIQVSGDAKIQIEGDLEQQVLGNYDLTVTGNYSITTSGDFDMEVAGTHTSKTAGMETRQASIIALN